MRPRKRFGAAASRTSFTPAIKGAVLLLFRAAQYARRLGVDIWACAEDISSLRALGVSDAQLRLLSRNGIVDHRVVTPGRSKRVPDRCLTLPENSFFVLTRRGAALARELAPGCAHPAKAPPPRPALRSPHRLDPAAALPAPLFVLTGERRSDRCEVLVGGRPVALRCSHLQALIKLLIARGDTATGFAHLHYVTASRLRRAFAQVLGSKAGKALIETGCKQEYRLAIPRQSLAKHLVLGTAFSELVDLKLVSPERAERLRCLAGKAPPADSAGTAKS